MNTSFGYRPEGNQILLHKATQDFRPGLYYPATLRFGFMALGPPDFYPGAALFRPSDLACEMLRT
jgi:hypothetical protein